MQRKLRASEHQNDGSDVVLEVRPTPKWKIFLGGFLLLSVLCAALISASKNVIPSLLEQHADYDGNAVAWGLGNKKASAAECCAACQQHKPNPYPCNVWVWCGDPSGVCWTADIHNHTTGDCWLKYQEGWDNNTDLAATNLKVNFRGEHTEAFRAEHKTAPKMVPWTAGLNPPS